MLKKNVYPGNMSATMGNAFRLIVFVMVIMIARMETMRLIVSFVKFKKKWLSIIKIKEKIDTFFKVGVKNLSTGWVFCQQFELNSNKQNACLTL